MNNSNQRDSATVDTDIVCFSPQVDLADETPRVICEVCYRALVIAVNFMKKVQTTSKLIAYFTSKVRAMNSIIEINTEYQLTSVQTKNDGTVLHKLSCIR